MPRAPGWIFVFKNSRLFDWNWTGSDNFLGCILAPLCCGGQDFFHDISRVFTLKIKNKKIHHTHRSTTVKNYYIYVTYTHSTQTQKNTYTRVFVSLKYNIEIIFLYITCCSLAFQTFPHSSVFNNSESDHPMHRTLQNLYPDRTCSGFHVGFELASSRRAVLLRKMPPRNRYSG